MRMLSGGRQRRILWSQSFDLSFQFVNLSLHAGLHLCHLKQQRLDKRPHRRCHLGQKLSRYVRHPCHQRDISDYPKPEKTNPDA